MYDAVVVGARCAGAPTAMLLARKGYKVLLVDRATFPSNIPHGHFIHRLGPRCLHRWGLLDRVVATGCPPITTRSTDTGDFPLVGTELLVDGVAMGYGPRRTALDGVLVQAAVEAGAELREGFAVEGFVADGDAIAGIRGRDRGSGATVTERARVTIGADGRHSRLAAAVRAPAYATAPTLLCWYFSYWSGASPAGLETYARPNRALFTHPTNDGLFCLFVAWPIAEQRAVQADLACQFLAAVDLVPEVAERVRGGHQEERFYGAMNLPNFLRKPYGPGWALVGDAGCHKDPYMALGVGDAFRDVDLLAEALDDGLSGRRPLGEALADYERRRNAATRADYEQNLALARFTPPSLEAQRLRQGLRGDQEATKQFYMATEGMIPREAFFNAENIQRLTGQATTGPT
jgi:flavin-dependent dehydrogenase